jgi:alkylation response protein AidB-like acyl-CoA dehydrogenase
VDFELTSDQQDLQEGVRSLLQGRFPIDTVREGFDPKGWRELADTGVFSLRLPEADGGVGLGTADAALVFEELGRSLVPGPLVGSHLAVTHGLAADGDVVGLVERGHPIANLDVLESLLVFDEDGVSRLAPADVVATAVDAPLDALTPMSLVSGGLPAGERVGGADLAARLRLEGTVLTSALLLGLSIETTEMATAYAKERHQFGRAIGSFQAVKHLLADMLTRAEVARAAVYAAAVTIDTPEVGDVERAVASAKVLAGEAAISNGKSCIQVHGGMGFTWEVPAHLYLKRAWVLDGSFGGVEEHAAFVATRLSVSAPNVV